MEVAVGIDIAKQLHWAQAIVTADSRVLLDLSVPN